MLVDIFSPYHKYIIYRQVLQTLHSKYIFNLSAFLHLLYHPCITHHHQESFRLLQERPKWCRCFHSCFPTYHCILLTVFRKIFKNFPTETNQYTKQPFYYLKNLKIKRIMYFSYTVKQMVDEGSFSFTDVFQLINKEGMIEL